MYFQGPEALRAHHLHRLEETRIQIAGVLLGFCLCCLFVTLTALVWIYGRRRPHGSQAELTPEEVEGPSRPDPEEHTM